MLNEEENEYEDFNKMLEISIHEVKNRAIVSARVIVRDATEDEIEASEEEEDE